jgi:hypothetical protein
VAFGTPDKYRRKENEFGKERKKDRESQIYPIERILKSQKYLKKKIQPQVLLLCLSLTSAHFIFFVVIASYNLKDRQARRQ